MQALFCALQRQRHEAACSQVSRVWKRPSLHGAPYTGAQWPCRAPPQPGRAWNVSSSPKHGISQRVLRAPGHVFPRHGGKLWTMMAWPQPYEAEVVLAVCARHAEAPGPRMRGASTSRSAASSSKSANTFRRVSASPRPPRRCPQRACPRGGCAVDRASRALAGRKPSVVLCISLPLYLTSHTVEGIMLSPQQRLHSILRLTR
jgi:hypothetical protein